MYPSIYSMYAYCIHIMAHYTCNLNFPVWTNSLTYIVLLWFFPAKNPIFTPIYWYSLSAWMNIKQLHALIYNLWSNCHYIWTHASVLYIAVTSLSDSVSPVWCFHDLNAWWKKHMIHNIIYLSYRSSIWTVLLFEMSCNTAHPHTHIHTHTSTHTNSS